MQYKPADIPARFIPPKLTPTFRSARTWQGVTGVTHLRYSGLWLELTCWVRLWSAPWLRQASLQIEITGRGEHLVHADSLDRLGMDHLHAAIVTTPPQRSGGATEWVTAAQRGDGPDWIVPLPWNTIVIVCSGGPVLLHQVAFKSYA